MIQSNAETPDEACLRLLLLMYECKTLAVSLASPLWHPLLVLLFPRYGKTAVDREFLLIGA